MSTKLDYAVPTTQDDRIATAELVAFSVLTATVVLAIILVSLLAGWGSSTLFELIHRRVILGYAILSGVPLAMSSCGVIVAVLSWKRRRWRGAVAGVVAAIIGLCDAWLGMIAVVMTQL